MRSFMRKRQRDDRLKHVQNRVLYAQESGLHRPVSSDCTTVTALAVDFLASNPYYSEDFATEWAKSRQNLLNFCRAESWLPGCGLARHLRKLERCGLFVANFNPRKFAKKTPGNHSSVMVSVLFPAGFTLRPSSEQSNKIAFLLDPDGEQLLKVFYCFDELGILTAYIM